jgi:hypothetical protein
VLHVLCVSTSSCDTAEHFINECSMYMTSLAVLPYLALLSAQIAKNWNRL